MGLNDNDLLEVQLELLENPKKGDIIKGTGGARKLRYAIRGKGKSGGARIIYVDIIYTEQIHLLLCYPKSVKTDLTNDEEKSIRAIINNLTKRGD
jgi:hypothetical protein